MIELENGARYLYQWELNKRVILGDFPPGTRVEFSHKYDCKDSALPVEAYEDGGHVVADIPNVFLQKAGYINVYVRPSADNLTCDPEMKDFKVVKKDRPTDYVYTETKTMTYEELEKRIADLEQKLAEGARTSIGYVELLAANWQGDENPYYQVVAIEGVTEKCQVDLTPSVEQLVVFYEKDLTFVTENEGGVVTVYAIGQKPSNDYTIQVTITEVSA